MRIKNNKWPIILMAIFLTGCQSNQQPIKPSSQILSNLESITEQANQAFDSKNYVKAGLLYDKVIAQQPDNLNAIFWASQLAHTVKDYDKEIAYLIELKKYEINRLKPRMLLVRAYQNNGDLAKRDNEHQQIAQLWEEGKISEYTYIRDQFVLGKYIVSVFDYFELKGDASRKYLFIAQKGVDDFFVILLSAKFNNAADKPIFYL